MFALHALWQADHRLALWAEDSAARRSLMSARPSRSTHPPGTARSTGAADRGADHGADVARTHPYACSAERVAALVGGAGAGLDWLVTRTGAGWSTLLMPSRGGVPLPSPELGGGLGDGTGGTATGARGAAELLPWHVPALLFAPGEAAQLLGELFDPGRQLLETAPPGIGGIEVPYGASLRWLTRVHDLAWRLVGRGQVLPALLVEEGTSWARWRPVPDAAGWREIGALTAAAPPVCRAEPPGRPAAEIVADLLDALVDCEARAVLESRPPLLRADRRPATAAERWLVALTSGTGRLDGADPAELTGLRDRLAAWLGSGEPATARLRTCFRLREPLGPDPADPMGRTSDDHWRLDFLLQAADEPSLLVDAADLWGGGPALTALERRADRPQEVFLAELGRAVRCYPELRRALRNARPAGLDLDRAEALGFLRDAAPLLTAAGFGVLLPSWWRRPATVGLTLTARTAQPGTVPAGTVVGQDAVVAFGWQAAIGDRTLTEQELRELAAIGLPLLRVRGQWVQVDQERIAEAVAFLERESGGTMPAGRVLRTALDPDASAGGLPVTGVVADGWLGDLLSGRADLRLEPVPVPAGFGATLRPYQERGLAWLAFLSRLGLGAVLADDMGLGKTPQTLALLAAEHPSGPTLLICPMSLVGNWQRETSKFAPMLRVHVHHGARRLSGAGLQREMQGADLVITTYATAQRDHEALRGIHWRRIILDEAQHIKNSATRQATAIRSLPAEHRIALTGTPVENRLADLHALLDFANPGLFGSAAGFRERYAVPIEQNGDDAAAAALRRRTGPFVLRRLKTDPAIARDLPEKQEMTVMCNLTAEQAGLYQAVVTDMVSRVENSSGIQRRGLVLSTLGKLKQICNHPAQFLRDGSPLAGRSGKLARLEEILEEALAEGDRTLCFTQYAEFGSLLRDHLTERLGREVLFLYGGVPKHAREEMIARFQTPSGPPVFLLSLKAGGTGLNLTAATQVIHVDRWWNPAVEQQATDRAFRLGQRENVQVRKFVCVGTVEERIDQMIHSKRALAESAVGTGEDRLTELSTEALRELVALSADAVSE